MYLAFCIALTMTPNLDRYRVGAVPKVSRRHSGDVEGARRRSRAEAFALEHRGLGPQGLIRMPDNSISILWRSTPFRWNPEPEALHPKPSAGFSEAGCYDLRPQPGRSW